MHDIDARLAELGYDLPTPAAPVASYVPTVSANGTLYISGQLPFRDGAIITGRLGDNVDLEGGVNAAIACGLGILAQAKAAIGGDWTRITQCVRLGGFVACTADFMDHPKVINGASDLMLAVFGDAGRHARAAVGAPSLPLGAAVEIDAIFALKE